MLKEYYFLYYKNKYIFLNNEEKKLTFLYNYSQLHFSDSVHNSQLYFSNSVHYSQLHFSDSVHYGQLHFSESVHYDTYIFLTV